jgi:hypothetical protein
MRAVVVLACVAGVLVSCIPAVHLVWAGGVADASRPELAAPGKAIPPFVNSSRANGQFRRLLNEIKGRAADEPANFGRTMSVREVIDRTLIGPTPPTLQSIHIRLQF